MKTKAITNPLAALAGGLLLAVSGGVSWAGPPWGPGGVPGALKACEADLQACLEEPRITFPGDGQLGGGAALSYTDNGDGTFIDENTGLMWEEKLPAEDPACSGSAQGSRDVHCVQNLYTWSDPGSTLPNGTAFDVFLAALNGGTGFAEYIDWRLPTIKELQSLVDYSRYNPSVATGLPGATAADFYWSSTSFAFNNGVGAWGVVFNNGGVANENKRLDSKRVRAVRGGW